jgi:Cu2+-exporting ATPase
MNHTMHDNHQQTAEGHTGHDRHAGHTVAMFRDKFWLSLILTLPVLFWSTDVQRWFGYTAPSFPGSTFAPAVLGTIVFFYGGRVFIRGAWSELVGRRPGMMTLGRARITGTQEEIPRQELPTTLTELR